MLRVRGDRQLVVRTVGQYVPRYPAATLLRCRLQTRIVRTAGGAVVLGNYLPSLLFGSHLKGGLARVVLKAPLDQERRHLARKSRLSPLVAAAHSALSGWTVRASVLAGGICLLQKLEYRRSLLSSTAMQRCTTTIAA